MPTKSATNGQPYQVDAKTFTWTTEDGDTVVLPLRIKVKVIRDLAERDMDVAAMFDMIEAIAPGQDAVLDEMDVNEFTRCFTTWQSEYTKLTGATPGE